MRALFLKSHNVGRSRSRITVCRIQTHFGSFQAHGCQKVFFSLPFFLGIFLIEPIFAFSACNGTFQVAQPNRPNSCPCRFHDCNKFFFHYLLHCDFFSVRLFHWTLLGLGTFPLLHLSLLSDLFRLTFPKIATVQC